jgi:hypothetical protein
MAGFRSMGLEFDNNNKVIINPTAIPDFKLMSSERVDREQSRSRLVREIEGDTVDLGNLNDRERRVCRAQREYWTEQLGPLPVSCTFKYRNPMATETTSSPNTHLAMKNDERRDVQRNKKTRQRIAKMASTAGINVQIADDKESAPTPNESFVECTIDEAMTVLNVDDARTCSLEKFEELILDENYSLWMLQRLRWCEVKSIVITKYFLKGPRAGSAAELTLRYGDADITKKFQRGDLKKSNYGRSGEGKIWILYSK